MDVILLRRKPYSRIGTGTDLFFNKFTCQLVNLPNFFDDKFHMLNSATTNDLCFLLISLMALPTDFRTYSLSSHFWECVKLFEKIWGYDYVADAATVSVHINRLREKIEDDARNPKIIETVWGAGYRLNR